MSHSLGRGLPCALSLTLLASVGCSRGGSGSHGGDNPPPTRISAANAATAGDFMRPFDSVPSADGSMFYFTGSTADGQPAVFKVPASGGTVTAVATGAPLTSPLGIAISSDDATLYVADPGAGLGGTTEETEGAASAGRGGAIFTVATSGGSPMVLAGTSGTTPRGLDVVREGAGEVIYFSGLGTDGQPGLFRSDGAAVSTVASGAPFVDPSGVAVAQSGDVYVANAGDAEGSGAGVIKVSGGAAGELIGDIAVGFPAGIALTTSDKVLLVSGHDRASHGDIVLAVDLATRGITSFNDDIGDNTDGGGLHRARNADKFSWSDSTAGGRGGVYFVQLTR